MGQIGAVPAVRPVQTLDFTGITVIGLTIPGITQPLTDGLPIVHNAVDATKLFHMDLSGLGGGGVLTKEATLGISGELVNGNFVPVYNFGIDVVSGYGRVLAYEVRSLWFALFNSVDASANRINTIDGGPTDQIILRHFVDPNNWAAYTKAKLIANRLNLGVVNPADFTYVFHGKDNTEFHSNYGMFNTWVGGANNLTHTHLYMGRADSTEAWKLTGSWDDLTGIGSGTSRRFTINPPGISTAFIVGESGAISLGAQPYIRTVAAPVVVGDGLESTLTFGAVVAQNSEGYHIYSPADNTKFYAPVAGVYLVTLRGVCVPDGVWPAGCVDGAYVKVMKDGVTFDSSAEILIDGDATVALGENASVVCSEIVIMAENQYLTFVVGHVNNVGASTQFQNWTVDAIKIA